MLFYSVGTFKSHHKFSKKKKQKQKIFFFLINNVSNKNQSKKKANSVIDMPWIRKGYTVSLFHIFIFYYYSKYSGDYLLPRWNLPRRKKGQKVREFWVLQHMVDLGEAHNKPKNFRVKVDDSIC